MQHTCPKCERPLRTPNAWHDCVKISIPSLFEGKKPELWTIFEKIHTTLNSWEGVASSASSNCIIYIVQKTFLIVRPMKQELDLKFYLREAYDVFPIYKFAQYSGKWEHHIRLGEEEDLDGDVWMFLRMAYDITQNSM